MKAHTINLVSAIELAQASTSMGVTRIYLAGGAEIGVDRVIIQKEARLLYAKRSNGMAWIAAQLEELVAVEFGVSDPNMTFPEMLAQIKRDATRSE